MSPAYQEATEVSDRDLNGSKVVNKRFTFGCKPRHRSLSVESGVLSNACAKGLVVRIKVRFCAPARLVNAVVSPVARRRPSALRNTHPKTAGQLYKPQRPNLPSLTRSCRPCE